MDERVLQFRVGVVVVAAASITVILVMLFGALPTLRPRYTLHIRFPEAPGVTIDTPVRKSGVQIGRVSNVKLLEQGGVVLTMRIDRRYPLRQNEVCRITSDSLVTGDAVLEWISKPGSSLSNEPLTDGEYLTNGEVAADPFEVLVNVEEQMMETFTSIQSAAGAIELAGGEVAVMVRGLNTAVGNNENQIRRIVQKTEESLDELRLTLQSVRGLIDGTVPQEAAGMGGFDPGLVAQVGQPGAQRPPIGPAPPIDPGGAPPLDPDAPPVGLRQALQGLPDVMRKAEATIQKTEETLDKFQQVAESAQRNLENLEDFTKPLGDQGQQLFQDVGSTINNVDTLVLQLTEFSRALNNRDSTVGQLVHDRELYDRLNSAIANVEDVTQRLRPILGDVRVFTDKVSRDPSRLIKGALDQRSPGMGLKRTYK